MKTPFSGDSQEPEHTRAEGAPEVNRVYVGECIEVMKTWPDAFVQTVVTSPPYWGLRDYGMAGQIGLEKTPEEYTAKMVEVFREVRRLLRDDGTLWLNLGDSYASDTKGSGRPSLKQDTNGGSRYETRKMDHGLKTKDLVGIPWRVAFALQADGWYLRSDIIWAKPNPMPESVTDRPTKAHEYLFLLTKSERYFYDAEAIAEPTVSDHGSGNGFKRDARLSFTDSDGPRGNDKPWLPNGKHSSMPQQSSGRRITEGVARARAEGADHDSPFGGTRNRRSVWTINTQPYAEAHFATFPPDLIKPCVLAGSRHGDIVFDPFMGAGTTALVAAGYGRNYLGIEMNPEYVAIAEARIARERAQVKMAI